MRLVGLLGLKLPLWQNVDISWECQMSDDVGANARMLLLMSAATLAGMAAITCGLVYLGPLIGL
jgi:hypothetical protein